MSYLDIQHIEQLTEWRKKKIGGKINELSAICSSVLQNMAQIKTQAQTIFHNLDCDLDPSEQKTRFLHGMRELDEYVYLLTEVDLGLQDFIISDSNPNINRLPGPTRTGLATPLQPTPVNMPDRRNDLAPVSNTSAPRINTCKPNLPNIRNKDDLIDLFGSTQSIDTMPNEGQSGEQNQGVALGILRLNGDDVSESDPNINGLPEQNATKVATSLQPTPVNLPEACNGGPSTSSAPKINICKTNMPKIWDEFINLPDSSHSIDTMPNESQTKQQNQDLPSVFESKECVIPQRTILPIHTICDAYILHVEELCVTILTGDPDEEFSELHLKLDDHYKGRTDFIPVEMLDKVVFCACYVDDNKSWFRCYMINPNYTKTTAIVHLVDIGSYSVVPNNKIMPLHPQFYTPPVFARDCHLAGIDFKDHSFETLSGITNFILKFFGQKCKVEVEDNSSEYVLCYLRLEDDRTINHMLVENGLAVHIGAKCTCDSVQEILGKKRAPQTDESSSTLEGHVNSSKHDALVDVSIEAVAPPVEEIINSPEYEDALVAVTGYHNRDETDICKHYKGPPHKTCFKGMRCKKKHIPMHPDGWTLDKKEIIARAPSLPLPAPGARARVRVTHVLDYNKLYVQFVKQPRPLRGCTSDEALPAMSLEELFRCMNSHGATYRPLEFSPAPGELVAAICPLDQKYYRARVLDHRVLEQTVDVHLVDYGTEHSIKERAVFNLDPVYTYLPIQSVLCTLSEVEYIDFENTAARARVKEYLTEVTLNKELEALVISHLIEELEISLRTTEGINVAEEMAAKEIAEYQKCGVDVSPSGLIPG